MKRKSDESAFEFRKRKKKEQSRKFHMYDYEKDYWKNESKKATREQKSGIEKLFAGVSGARTAKDMYDFSGVVEPVATAVEGIFANPYLGAGAIEGMGSAVTAGAAVGAGLSIAGAAGAGYLAGELVNSLFDQTNIEDVEQIISLMPGTYQGKFALSARASQKGLRDKYQKKGSVYIIENYGSVSDPDLVYVGHSTWNSGCLIIAVGTALLRKLFRVGCKFDTHTIYEELPLLTTVPDSGPNAFVICYETRDSDGTQVRKFHNIPNDSSLESLLNLNQDGFVLYNNLYDAITTANPNNLEKVYLYQREPGATLRLLYQMDMSSEVLSVAMSSHMVIQNRTKASGDGSASTTQVDVQPLKGPIFEFSVGVPKLKNDTPIQLNQADNQGLILVRAGQFGGTDTTSYKEPPVKKAFQNVVKTGYTRLNPGALKSMTCGVDCRGYFGNVLHKLRYAPDGTQTKRCYGKSQMACFEEELNSGSANNITIQFECQHIVGAEFTTTMSSNMQPGYFSGPVNNNP